MTLVSINILGRSILLDVCRACELVWFDPSELEALPHPVPQAEIDPAQKAREAVAMYQVRRLKEEAKGGSSAPDSAWGHLAGILGFPVEDGAPPVQSLPLLTWFATIVCILAYWLTYDHIGAAAQGWGLIPADALRHHGATFLTSMFLHGGLLHLASNLYFLLIFGDNVEETMGKLLYLPFVLASGLAASLTHILFNQGSMVPCVGASGFISGVIAAYAVLFPQVRICVLMRLRFYYFRWVALPASGAFLLWMAGQGLAAWLTAGGEGGGVAYGAHLGGALFGLAVGFLMRRRLRRRAGAFDSE